MLKTGLFKSGASVVPTGWRWSTLPCRRPAGAKMRVRVLASGVEYIDVVFRRHLYPHTMRRQPSYVLSDDVVGEIDQLGHGEDVLRPRPTPIGPAHTLH